MADCSLADDGVEILAEPGQAVDAADRQVEGAAVAGGVEAIERTVLSGSVESAVVVAGEGDPGAFFARDAVDELDREAMAGAHHWFRCFGL